MRYAPDKIILEMRAEIKLKVIVTKTLYATLHHSKMHPHTILVIPISNSILDMLRPQIVKKLGQNQGHSDPKIVCDTAPSHDVSHTIFVIPPSNNIGDMSRKRLF